MSTIIWAGVGLPTAHGPAQHDFAVCVDSERIVATGPRAQLTADYPAAEQVGGDEYLLLPGFTNSHDHGRGLGTFPLGVDDDLLEIWLPGLYSQPAVDPYLLSAWEGIMQLRAGVTLSAHSHNPQDWRDMEAEAEAVLRGYDAAGLRVAFHPPLVDQNPLVYADRDAFLKELPSTVAELAQRFLRRVPLSHDEYFDLCRKLYRRHHDSHSHKVYIQVSPSGGQWCSDELILAATDFARAHQTRVQMHMLETRYQAVYAYQKWEMSYIQHLAEIGALGPWLTLAHMIWVDPPDLPLLSEHGVAIAHNPGSNLRLRSGIAPLPSFVEHALTVGIGMDGQTLDDDQDYLREMRLALTLANRPGAESETIEATTILEMGLAGGAHTTLGMDQPLGRLEPGAAADLVLIDWDAVRAPWTSPRHSPQAVLLRRAVQRHVRHVMVAGDWKVRDGKMVHVDEREIAAAIQDQLEGYSQQELARAAAAAEALAPYLRRFYANW